MADRVGTIRVHPDDDPRDPQARRVILTDRPGQLPWQLITGVDGGRPGSDWHSRADTEIGLGPTSEVMGQRVWPRQDHAEYALVMAHADDPQGPPAGDPVADLACIADTVADLRSLAMSDLAPYGEDISHAREALVAVLAHATTPSSPTAGGTP